MANALKIAAPPPRRPANELVAATEREGEAAVVAASPPAPAPVPQPAAKSAPRPARATKFSQVKEDDRVQFNKRVTRRVADGFEMLAIRSRHKVPDLLAEALELLEQRYGKVG